MKRLSIENKTGIVVLSFYVIFMVMFFSLVQTADSSYGFDTYEASMLDVHNRALCVSYIKQITTHFYPDVDPYIALATLELESDYQPGLTSYAGAIGLMQVLPEYHAWRIEKYGLDDIWDPYANILCGIDFLNDLYSSRGNWSDALYGYNADMGYVNSVLARADILRKGGCFA